ncbi:hypothetical protein NA57DRAFT_44530 [Rhizodiscina lignyota]|uniref:Uncharacterized protein n=1 Tax=Rhizodiscina lignyota TaxID=1504668 RepID=A0A9P4I9Z4_9PEZI|nr:hypothetical protein NA57DRAFT_44530 [Rhizodiscina lignyota]
MAKPILLHCGDDIKWNKELYKKIQDKFEIRRSYSMNRADFIKALKDKTFGDFVAIYRPFWPTGGEMGRWDSELIDILPKSCKIYASSAAGFDWVDVKRLAERGVIYCNAAAACTESVADAGIWHMIGTFRLTRWAEQAAESCDPKQFFDTHNGIALYTTDPLGKKLGIIGLGRIGYRIAQKAYLAFGMKILYNDIRQMSEDVEKSVEATYYEKLDEMLPQVDCLVVATPFGGDQVVTHDTFAKMKQGSRFVNIARGKLVNEDALIEALESGKLSSAGLDVFFDEPNMNKKLVGMRNVQITAHTAGASIDSHMGFETMGMENILGFFENGKPISPVNLQWLKKE